MRTIAVFGAMDEEVALFATHLRNVEHLREAGLDVIVGTIATKSGETLRVAATVAGMGMVAAGAATQFLITRFSPEAVIFSGIAGNISNRLGVNDVVLGGTVRYLDSDMELIGQAAPGEKEYHSDARLLELAGQALDSEGVKHVTGVIATGNHFIDTADKREDVRRQTNADAVEMEGAGVLHIADKNQVPAIVIRALSDNTDTAYSSFRHFDISAYADIASRVVAGMVERL